MAIKIERDSMGSFFLNRGSPVKEISPHIHGFFPSIQNGLDFILSHFTEPICPRTVMAGIDGGIEKQVIIYDKEEALQKFRQARLLDSRINAYHSHTEWRGLNRQAPDFLFIDLDLSRFKSIEALNMALKKTLKFMRDKFEDDDIYPSVLWTGNGYHIYLPVTAFVLELESIFAAFEEPSKQFIRWAEQFLTNNKADPCHSNSLSAGNCMLRVPGSFNSKLAQRNEKGEIVNIPESAEVKIVQESNGVKPSIKPLLSEFYIYLADSKIKEIYKNRKPGRHSFHYDNNHKIQWIETLSQIPIADRKYALWRIVAPYLMNIKKLTYEDAFNVATRWLNTCDKIRSLDFNANVKIKYTLRAATRVGYLPIGLNNLESENGELEIRCHLYLTILLIIRSSSNFSSRNEVLPSLQR